MPLILENQMIQLVSERSQEPSIRPSRHQSSTPLSTHFDILTNDDLSVAWSYAAPPIEHSPKTILIVLLQAFEIIKLYVCFAFTLRLLFK
jgi:hypothetical protein